MNNINNYLAVFSIIASLTTCVLSIVYKNWLVLVIGLLLSMSSVAWFYFDMLNLKDNKKKINKINRLSSDIKAKDDEIEQLKAVVSSLQLKIKENFTAPKEEYVCEKAIETIVKSDEEITTEKYNAMLKKGGNSFFRFVNTGKRFSGSCTGDDCTIVNWKMDANGLLAGININDKFYVYPAVEEMSGDNLKHFGPMYAFDVNKTDIESRSLVKICNIEQAAIFMCNGNEWNLLRKGKLVLQ